MDFYFTLGELAYYSILRNNFYFEYIRCGIFSVTDLCLHLSAIGCPFAFRNCPDVANAFSQIFVGWPLELKRETAADRPCVIFSKTENGYQWETPWPDHMDDGHEICLDLRAAPQPLTTLADFHNDLFDWLHYRFSDELIFEATALETASGVILLTYDPSQDRIVTELKRTYLAEGGRVFSCGVVRLKPNSPITYAAGLQPREAQCRQPNRRDSLTHGYMALGNDHLASFGEEQMVIGVITVEFRDQEQAVLQPSTAGRAARATVRRMDHRHSGPEQSAALVDSLKAFDTALLTCSDGREAGRLLINQFGVPDRRSSYLFSFREALQPADQGVVHDRARLSSHPALRGLPFKQMLRRSQPLEDE